jgi:hypothetical protein
MRYATPTRLGAMTIMLLAQLALGVSLAPEAGAHQVNVSGRVTCYSTGTVNYLWMYRSNQSGAALSDAEGWWAHLSDKRLGSSAYSKGFSRIPSGGSYITAKWKCSYGEEHRTTFYMYDRNTRRTLCPWSGCF